MRIIELTSLNDGGTIYINIECIGHFYEVKEKSTYGKVDKKTHTRVGTTTHNNGGFEVKETPKQIMKLIETSRGL
jgi:hypothetical protein